MNTKPTKRCKVLDHGLLAPKISRFEIRGDSSIIGWVFMPNREDAEAVAALLNKRHGLPEPKFYASPSYNGNGNVFVYERPSNALVGKFFGPWAKRVAEGVADRLNQETAQNEG